MMKKWTLALLCLGFIHPPAAVAHASPPFQVADAAEKQMAKMKGIIQDWNTLLESEDAKSDPYHIFEQVHRRKISSLMYVRLKVMMPFFGKDKHMLTHPTFQNTYQELLSLRDRLARKGMALGPWKMWKYDQLTLNKAQAKQVFSMDRKVNALLEDWKRPGRGYSAKLESDLKAVKAFLKDPALQKEPLKTYKDKYLSPQIQGMEYLLKHKKASQ